MAGDIEGTSGDPPVAPARPSPEGRKLPAPSAPAHAETDESLLARIAADMRAGGPPMQTLLASFVAWSVTVAPTALSRAVPRSALAFAALSLVSGVSGALLRGPRPSIARHLGISAFFVLSTLTWLLGSAAIQPPRLDPLRAAVGAVAWAAYALSWRDRWEAQKSEPAADPGAPVLQARATLPPAAIPVAVIGVAASLVYVVLAWSVRDGERALAAQALSIACAVAVITVAASVAVDRGKRPARSSRRVTAHAARALLLLVVVAVGGAAIMIFRG
jgi:hypothetical protein